MFLIVAGREHHQNRAVKPYRGLYHIGGIALIAVCVEILHLAARYAGMVAQVEVCTRVDAFHLFESEGEVEFDIHGSVGVVGQLIVRMVAVVLLP